MCDENNYTCNHCTEILKVWIAGTIILPKMKKLWGHINDSLYKKLLYTIMSIVIVHFLKLQQEDLIAQTIQKRLVTPNVNIY